MSEDSQDDGHNVQKQEDSKRIPIHNGTHKGGPAAEGGRPIFVGRRPPPDGYFFIVLLFLNIVKGPVRAWSPARSGSPGPGPNAVDPMDLLSRKSLNGFRLGLPWHLEAEDKCHVCHQF
jgi:hypothetical protein